MAPAPLCAGRHLAMLTDVDAASQKAPSLIWMQVATSPKRLNIPDSFNAGCPKINVAFHPRRSLSNEPVEN
jgi:hypothetical protein